MAGRAGMSPRTFNRVFAPSTGTTPARFLEQARCERARTLLLDADLPLRAGAPLAGFGSASQMRRSFSHLLSLSPSDYRARFGSSAPA